MKVTSYFENQLMTTLYSTAFHAPQHTRWKLIANNSNSKNNCYYFFLCSSLYYYYLLACSLIVCRHNIILRLMRATHLTTRKHEEQPQQLSLTCRTFSITANACLGYPLPVRTKTSMKRRWCGIVTDIRHSYNINSVESRHYCTRK